jgi:hypothetical protein
MIHTLRILWNKAAGIIRPDVVNPCSEAQSQAQVQDSTAAARDCAAREMRPDCPADLRQRSAGEGVLGGELYRLAMRWRATGRWPAQTTAHIAKSLGQDVCLHGLERGLWQMGRAMGAPHDLPRQASLHSVFGGRNHQVIDLIRVRLHQEHAAHTWMDAFFRARFADLPDEDLRRTGLLDCLDARLIDPGAFATSTYLPGDSRETPADEVMLDGTSTFDDRPSHMSAVVASDASPGWQGTPGSRKVPIDTIRGLARQALARIRRDTERSSHTYGKAANALLRLGPVMRSMEALQVETDAAYRRQTCQFLLTEQGERLVSVLPMARYLPDVIAARIDDLSYASARIHGLQWAAQSEDPLTMCLSQAGQASAVLGVQRSAWDAACRLLLFPESAAACQKGSLSRDFTGDFISTASAEHQQRLACAFEERRLTDTFVHDLFSHEVGDQLHGAIAGYAMNRLWPALPAGRAAGLTQRWCQAWADLMTVCGPG